MQNGLKNLSFQYIDIFSEVSSNSGLSLDKYYADLFDSQEDTNKYTANTEHIDDSIIAAIELESIFNPKLKIIEQHTDLELLRPEGIEATKFNTGILKNKHSKKVNSNRKISYFTDQNNSRSAENMAKLSSTQINSSSTQTFYTQKKDDTSTNELRASYPRTRLASTPNIVSQVGFYQINKGFSMPQPQYCSGILNKPFPASQVMNSSQVEGNYTLYHSNNKHHTPQHAAYPPFIWNCYPQAIVFPHSSTFSTAKVNSYNIPVTYVTKDSSKSQPISNEFSAYSAENLISYIISLSQTEDLISYICTSNGCKEVQRRLHRMNGETANFLLKLISNLKAVEKIMKDPFANYIFQKSAELASPNIRILLLNDIEPQVSSLGCDVFGSHCLQKFVQIMNNDAEISLFNDIISKAASTLSCNTYGAFIVLKALSGFPEKKRYKLNIELLQNLTSLIKDAQGVCVVSPNIYQ